MRYQLDTSFSRPGTELKTCSWAFSIGLLDTSKALSKGVSSNRYLSRKWSLFDERFRCSRNERFAKAPRDMCMS